MKKNKRTSKWLYNVMRGEKYKLALLIISHAIFSLLSVAFALAIKMILDGATNEDKIAGRTGLIDGAIFIGILVVCQFIFRLIFNGLTERLKARIENICRINLFSAILSKHYDKITKYHSGELVNRLSSDTSIVADGITSILPQLISAGVRLISAVVVLVVMDWVFAVAFIIAGILVFVTMTIMRSKLKALHKDVQKTSGKTHSFMQECIENLLAVKAFSVDKKIQQNAEVLQQENYAVKMRRKKYSVGGHAIYNMIFSAGYVFALIYGAFNIHAGIMTYGALSAILQLVNNVQVPFASISSVFPKYYAMIASAERIMEVEDMEDELSAKKEDIEKLGKNFSSIEFNNVSFAYEKDSVLRNANLTVNRGDFVAITGNSGIGKSTLLKLLLGVYDVQEGSIEICCKNKRVEVNSGTRKIFSYVPQQNLLFSGSIYDNLTLISGEVKQDEINEVLRVCALDEFVLSLKDGLETRIGENGLGLSEGQIQRIAIGRALLSKAPILLLDECTSALDENTEKQILSNLKAIKDLTILLISHKKAVLDVSDKNVKITSKSITML